MFAQAQPNALAALALLLWPLVALGLVAAFGPRRGAVATILGGYLLLPPAPAGLDLPLLPPLTKDSIPGLAALAAVLLLARPRPRLLPEHPAARALLALFFLVPVATVLANSDPVAWGRFALPGLRLREAAGIALFQATAILPLLLGRALLGGQEGPRALLGALAWGGLLYSLPMLVEVRLAPQINVWVYGFFQHSFDQMMRGDGFRPIVFLYHGLWAAFLVVSALAAALALGREALAGGQGRRAVLWGLGGAWLLMTLVLCKSMASLLYGVLLAPLVLLAPRRLQMGLALGLALAPLAYPAAKTVGLVPQEAILALAERASPERAASLRFRMETEDALLARAAERPLVGWGLWGRNLILEPDTGRQLSIPDGRWIIVLGTFGWAGLGAVMGLLILPVALAWRRAGPEGPPLAVAALALLLAVNLADLVPNATETPLTWLAAGCLLGWAERQRRGAAAPAGAALGRTATPPAFATVIR